MSILLQSNFLPFEAALLGLVLGSFLNVVIYRLPKMIEFAIANAVSEITGKEQGNNEKKVTLSSPASSCTSCGHVIRWYENIPVISYLFLRGKCGSCGASISLRYPSVEILSSLVAYALYLRFGPSIHFLAFLLFSLSLIAIAMIDYDHMIIPDEIVQPLVWIGLVYGLYFNQIGIYQSLMGAVVGYMIFYLLDKVMTRALNVSQAVGAGDFKLMAAVGAFLGLSALTSVVMVASIIFLLSAIIIRKLRPDAREMPYGPAISAASILAIFFVNDVKQVFLF